MKKKSLSKLFEEMRPKTARKARKAKLEALAIASIIEHTQADYVMANPVMPQIVTIVGPALRKHFDPKYSARSLEAAMRNLFDWGILLSYRCHHEVFVVTLNPPRGMKADAHDGIKRKPPTLPNLAAAMGDTPSARKKAKVLELKVRTLSDDTIRELNNDQGN